MALGPVKAACKKGPRPEPSWSGAFLVRALGRNRTCGLLLRRQTLYPLSYEGGDPPGVTGSRSIGRTTAYRIIADAAKTSGCGSVQGQRPAAASGEHIGDEPGLTLLRGEHLPGQNADLAGYGVFGAVFEHRDPALVVAQHEL